MKQEHKKIRLDTKLTDEFLDLKTLSPNAILEHLDEQIGWRELSVEAKVKKMRGERLPCAEVLGLIGAR